MPNPYAEGEGGLRVGEKGVWPRPQQPKPTAARVAAQNAGPREGETEKKSTLKLVACEFWVYWLILADLPSQTSCTGVSLISCEKQRDHFCQK